MKHTSLFIPAGIFTAVAFCLLCYTSYEARVKEQGFVYLRDVLPAAHFDIRYAGTDNFMGRKVDGYRAAEALMTSEAATALTAVQNDLQERGLSLKIFDAYRPQRAVDHFVRWTQDLSDTLNKRAYYPDVPKDSLFALGYIAAESGHSRGSTVDLTLVDAQTGKELDMGGPYDFFGPISHHDASGITAEQHVNRDLLRSLMEHYGFAPYAEEWWHYTLRDEPWAETYFDFVVRR